MKKAKQWHPILGDEFGDTLHALFEWSSEYWLEADLMMESPPEPLEEEDTDDNPLGVHDLGRTSQGVFGVLIDSTVQPIEERAIYFTRFRSNRPEKVADNLRSFLTTHPSLADVRETLREKVEAIAQTTEKRGEEPANPTTKLNARGIAKFARESAKQFIKERGIATSLVVDIGRVTMAKKKGPLVVEVSCPFPERYLEMLVQHHPFLQDFRRDLLNALTEEFDVPVDFTTTFYDESFRADRLIKLVKSAPDSERVIEFLTDVSGAS